MRSIPGSASPRMTAIHSVPINLVLPAFDRVRLPVTVERVLNLKVERRTG